MPLMDQESQEPVHETVEVLQAKKEDQKRAKQQAFLKDTYGLLATFIFTHVVTLIVLMSTMHNASIGFIGMVKSRYWWGTFLTLVVTMWALLMFRCAEKPFHRVKYLNWFLVITLIVSMNCLLISCVFAYGSITVFLIPVVVVLGYVMFNYFIQELFLYTLMSCVLGKNKHVDAMPSCERNSKFVALGSFLMISLFVIIYFFGAKAQTWILVSMLFLEVILLLVDQALLTRRYMKQKPNDDQYFDHIYGAVKLYTDTVTIVGTIISLILGQK